MPTKKIQLRIDGEMVNAEDGESILKVARRTGKYIPTLCHLDGLTDVGACRLCLVEVSGVGRLLPACTTPVQDGMSVTTSSPKIARPKSGRFSSPFARKISAFATAVNAAVSLALSCA